MENKTSESWLQAGEAIVMKIAANHNEGSSTRGGRLWLTNMRLVFTPHALDRGLGASSVSIPLSQIVNVGKEPAGCGPQAWFSGGIRARLRVAVADGSTHLFVVNNLDRVTAQIQHMAHSLPESSSREAAVSAEQELPQYSPSPRTSYPSTQRTNTLASMSVVVGIAGMLGIALCCCSPILTAGWCALFGIPAAIMGYLAKQQIAASEGAESGEQMALAAMVLGGVEIAVAILGTILFILAILGLAVLPTLESMFSSF